MKICALWFMYISHNDTKRLNGSVSAYSYSTRLSWLRQIGLINLEMQDIQHDHNEQHNSLLFMLSVCREWRNLGMLSN